MNVESVNNSSRAYSSQQTSNRTHNADLRNAEEISNIKKQGDTLVLSAEAKSLKPIEANIQSGAYNKPEVLKNVAEKLNQLFPSTNKI